MRVFVVCDHEPLPIDPGQPRLMRAGMLTAALADAGHDVTWFTSSFDHYLKRQRGQAGSIARHGPGLAIEVLPTPGYPANTGAQRVFHNRAFASAFSRAVTAHAPPDAVIAAIPATDSAAAAVRYARRAGAASIVDVYDPWPDSFKKMLPRSKLILGWPVIAHLHRQSRFACTNATALFAISEGYLDWGRAKGQRGGKAPDRVFPLSYMPHRNVSPNDRHALLGRLGIEPHHRIVSFVGTWGSTHDLAHVADAAAQLAACDDIRFVIAGRSEGDEQARAAFERLPNVVLAGWLDAPEIATLLGSTDVGLLPYRAGAPQSLPNKVFEYLAYGAFQIGSLTGEIEAFYNSTGAGWVVPPTGGALAAAIRRYFSTPESTSRHDRIAAFDAGYAGSTVYRQMVESIEEIAIR
ncbi:MAG TPA: glycosyltransferase [Devosia sp.]|nr:glycosyltransferase [Devosia sp.]